MEKTQQVSVPFIDLVYEGSPFETKRANVNGFDMTLWADAPETLRDILEMGRQWPNRELFVFESKRITYADHLVEVAKLAHALRSRFGVSKGDRVAIAMRNCTEWSVSFWATVCIGAIAVPLNAFMQGAELAYCLEDTDAKVLIADDERIARLGSEALSNRQVISTGEAPAQVWTWAQALDNQPVDLPETNIQSDDAATIFFTSGTTGKPKGTIATHLAVCQNVVSNCLIDAAQWRLEHADLSDFDQTASGMTTLLSIPLFHVAGCHGVLVYGMYVGRRIVFLARWNVEQAIVLSREYEVTHLIAVPAQYVEMVDYLEGAPDDVPKSAIVLIMGAAPPPNDLPNRLKRYFPTALIATGYGQTECTQIAATSWQAHFLERTKSCGAPVPIVEAKIAIGAEEYALHEAGGLIGELLIRSPIVATSYFGKPDATQATFGGGWLHTGDLVSVEPGGFITIVDRTKDMVIRGGENIYCIEVEQALYSHPDIIEAAVFGRPHRVLGEEPIAVIYAAPGADVSEADLQAYVQQRLARFKTPVAIFISEEPLARNANGKILKGPLRDKHAVHSISA